MITQAFNLNLIPEQAPVVIHCDQYDKGTGRLVISLFEDSVAYTPSGTAVVQGEKPDGKGFSYSATLSGNTVTANLTEQMTAVAGKVRCQLVITETSGRTGTFVFILDVQKSALPSDTDMSASEYEFIEEAIEECQDAVTAVRGYSEDAEAWAVGERGGVPVASGDETYHNNSEYYAQLAQSYAQGGLKYKGSVMFANIPTTGLTAGDMYNIEDDFTTDNRFQEGAGIAVSAGTNIAYNTNNKWDLLATQKPGVNSFNGRTGAVTPATNDYSLPSLSDVTVSSASDGQALVYESASSKWKNKTISAGAASFSALTDVSFSNLSNGQIAKYNSSTQKWENANESSGGATTLSALTDVSISSASNGQVLTWDSTAQKWKNATSQSGGILPKLLITSDAGSTVTVTYPDSTVVSATQVSGSTTQWECIVPGFGTYTIDAVLSGDDAQASVVVDTCKIYTIDDTHFSATITATFSYSAGATCRCYNTSTGENYYASGSSPYTFTVHHAVTYTVVSTIDGESRTATVTITTNGETKTVNVNHAELRLNYDNVFKGETLTIANGTAGVSYTKTAPSGANTVSFYAGHSGQWAISSAVSGHTFTAATSLTEANLDAGTYKNVSLTTKVTVGLTIYGATNATIHYSNDYASGSVTLEGNSTMLSLQVEYFNGTATTFEDTTVSKDPSDLSANYTKNVNLTATSSSVYVMPDNALYWYGYRSASLENFSTANGWTYSGGSFVEPTSNTNSLSLIGASSKVCGVPYGR